MVGWPLSREKQRQFVLSYLACGFQNATEAARQAGYSIKVANRQGNALLTKTDFSHVQEVIAELKQLFDERSTELSIMTAVELQQFFSSVVRGEVKDTELVYTSEGKQEVLEIPARLRERLKAADSLVKIVDNKSEDTGGQIIIIDNQAKELEGLIDDL